MFAQIGRDGVQVGAALSERGVAPAFIGATSRVERRVYLLLIEGLKRFECLARRWINGLNAHGCSLCCIVTIRGLPSPAPARSPSAAAIVPRRVPAPYGHSGENPLQVIGREWHRGTTPMNTARKLLRMI